MLTGNGNNSSKWLRIVVYDTYNLTLSKWLSRWIKVDKWEMEIIPFVHFS